MAEKPTPIIGYRQLSENEIANMNESKAIANKVGDFIDALTKDGFVDQRWLAIAKTDLQKGFMALNRSIAKPNSF